MNREFANVIVRDYGGKFYSLLRVNLKQHLFHRSAAAAEKASNKKGLPSAIPRLEPLPKHKINFSTAPNMEGATDWHFFSLLKGQAEGRVMFVDACANPVMYDIDMDAVVAMPGTNFCKERDSITLSMARPGGRQDDEQHYVLSKEPENVLFEVLEYGRNGAAKDPSVEVEEGRWHWQHLPSPPMRGPYLSNLQRRAVFHPSAAAVVDETTLCVSSVDAGAYAFDTVKGEWRQAGSWALPFHGAAEYVPELGLWFGVNAAIFDNPHHCLGAFDLSSWPPVEHRTWNYLDPLSDEWLTWQRHLLNLGSGKFCIATSFKNIEWHPVRWSTGEPIHGLDDEMVEHDLTILTGVEVVRCGDGLKMINHKSKRFEGIEIHCVL